MREDFELDKIIIAILIAMFTVVMSANIGSIFYNPNKFPDKKGFEIEVAEGASGALEQKGLPEVIDIVQVMSEADIEVGKRVFNKCAVCHTIDKDGANKIGPNLWNIVGAPTAHHSDFAYSASMKKRGEEGKKWSFEDLYRYLYSPKQYVPGTKMAFAGIKNDKERVSLIEYLRTMADNPLPLPTTN